MKVTAHKFFDKINSYVPGKAKIDGQLAIKLSSNENALGASPKAIEAYKNGADNLERYPDGSCSELRELLAGDNNIESDNIVCGAGSDELLFLLTSAFAGKGDQIIHSAHAFLMYEISANRVGATAVKVPEVNLKTDIDAILGAITDKTKIIFIANPNNPTGSYLNKGEIDKLISNTPKNILIVLDHAYDEFVTASDYPNSLELVKNNQNVVVTRTFSKIHGLANLRIGWCYAQNDIAKVLNKARGPFNVSGAAQMAAIAALKDREFALNSTKHNQKWLDKFFAEFANFKNIKAYPSVANFILLQFKNNDICNRVNQILLQNNIIIRQVASYDLADCLRMSIGSDSENNQILQVLKEIDDELS